MKGIINRIFLHSYLNGPNKKLLMFTYEYIVGNTALRSFNLVSG